MNPKPQPSTATGQLQSILRDGAKLSDVTTRHRTTAAPLYPAIISDKPRLRVGVMLDDWLVPAWTAEVLRSVQHSGVAELTTVILNREPPPARRSLGKRLLRVVTRRSAGPSTLLWHLYVRVEERLRPNLATPFHPTNVQGLLASAKVIDVQPIRKESVCRFNEVDTEAIKRNSLDVILRFGFNIPSREILSAARYGVWSYHHGDNNEYRGGPAGFWEMYERNPLTGTILQVLTDDLAGGRVIYRTYRPTGSVKSLLVNRHRLYRKSIPFVARCLRRVYEHGPVGISPEAKAPVYTRRLYRTPRNSQMLLFFMRAAYKMLTGLLPMQPNHWFLGVARGVASGQRLFGRVAALHPPKGRFWADPMIARSNGKTFIFFEDYVYKVGRGHISVLELDAGGRAGTPRTALEADHHLSYPFVFEWRGAHFMVPETADVNAVRLYRAAEFPTRWEYVQDLLSDIKAFDTTLCEHDGRWYLFTAVNEAGDSSCDELFLFVADTPLGPWAPHPMNPIVSDVRSARPGGPLFRRDGVLYRPGQNSEKYYGHSLAVFEVTELTPDRYSERLAYRIEPDWLPSIHGCHTITMADDMMVLDCKTLKWRP